MEMEKKKKKLYAAPPDPHGKSTLDPSLEKQQEKERTICTVQDEARRSKEREGGQYVSSLGGDEDRKNPAEKRREEKSKAGQEWKTVCS